MEGAHLEHNYLQSFSLIHMNRYIYRLFSISYPLFQKGKIYIYRSYKVSNYFMFNISTNLEKVCIHNRVHCYYIRSNPYPSAQ